MAGVACQGIWDRGGCLRCGGFRWGGFRWGGFRVGGSCEVGWTAAGWLCRCSRGPRVQGVVGVAHSRASGVGGNRGITRNSNVGSGSGSGSGSGHAPMCVDPLIAHGSPTATHHAHHGKPVIPTKTSRRPAGTPPSHVQHPRHPHPPGTPHPTQPTHHKLQPEPDRSRRGTRPISARSTTDLGAELDRSRCGVRPISRSKCRNSPPSRCAKVDAIASTCRRTRGR